VYVANFHSDSVSVFASGTGALAPVTCDPATNCKTGSTPSGVALTPDGTRLYTANTNANSVSVFSVNVDRSLSPVACDPATVCKAGNFADGIAVDPLGRYVYVTNGSGASVSVFSIGGDGALSPVACDPATACKTGLTPEGIAVDPSGRYVYVTNISSSSVSAFSIGSGGALAPVACDPATVCQTGSGADGIAVDPSGRYVYVSNVHSNSVSVYSIGAGGVLAPVACDPATICKTGDYPAGIAIDPSGSRVYTANAHENSVSVFSIGAGGALAPVACDPATICKTGDYPAGIAVDAAGSQLYVANRDSNSVSVFATGTNGALAPVACNPATICKTGNGPSLFSLAVSPDRGPAAAFSVTAAPAGSASAFDGAGSSSPDYPIGKYRWDFGDGQTATGSEPAVQHSYALPGNYTVSLVVVDQASCGETLVYTGQTASCNGSAKARAAHTVTVPAVAVATETISPFAFRAALSGPSARAAKKRPYGAKVTYTLNGNASVRFRVKQSRPGRLVGTAGNTRCVRPTRKNGKKHRCTRLVTLRGSFARAGGTGENRFRFTGRLRGKRLAPGSYRLVATPRAGSSTGRAASAAFKIVR
jgi:YVTN family beta-propeller protein